MFLEIIGGYINAKYVVRIFEQEHGTYAMMEDGSRYKLVTGESDKIENAEPLLPARQGDTALVLNMWEENGDIQHHLSEQPIIAWRIFKSGCEPVLIDDDKDAAVGVLLPGGQVLVPADAYYETRERFVTDQLERFRKLRKVVSSTL